MTLAEALRVVQAFAAESRHIASEDDLPAALRYVADMAAAAQGLAQALCGLISQPLGNTDEEILERRRRRWMADAALASMTKELT